MWLHRRAWCCIGGCERCFFISSGYVRQDCVCVSIVLLRLYFECVWKKRCCLVQVFFPCAARWPPLRTPIRYLTNRSFSLFFFASFLHPPAPLPCPLVPRTHSHTLFLFNNSPRFFHLPLLNIICAFKTLLFISCTSNETHPTPTFFSSYDRRFSYFTFSSLFPVRTYPSGLVHMHALA